MKNLIIKLKVVIVATMIIPLASCAVVEIENKIWKKPTKYLMTENSQMEILIFPGMTANVGFCSFEKGSWLMKISHLNRKQQNKTIESFWYYNADKDPLSGLNNVGIAEVVIPIIAFEEICLRNFITNPNEESF